jgi:VanZ family protein
METRQNNSNMKTRIILGVLWIAVLFSLLFWPISGNSVPAWGGFPYWDKVAHFGLFGVTAFVGLFVTGSSVRFRYRLSFSLVLGLALAAGTELGQAVVPHRDMSIYDFLADLAGLVGGLFFYVLLYQNAKLRSLLRL